MNEATGFRTVLRGYDPAQVDQRLLRLVADLHASQDRCADLGRRLETLEQRLTERAAASEPRPVDAPARTFADLGARIGQILALAEEEAAEVMARADAEAEAVRREADAAARLTRVEVQRYESAVRTDADTEAQRILTEAQRRADDVVDAAEREATARQEEGQALWEEHRARAAQAAADFELTLASRRDRAEAEFSARTREAEDQLGTLERAAAAVRARTDDETSEAGSSARHIIEDARSRAEAILAEARGKADRVRAESERELAAASQRRDSINHQLTNVRKMLTTLSGSVPVIGFEQQGDAEAVAAQQTDPGQAGSTPGSPDGSGSPDSPAGAAPAAVARSAAAVAATAVTTTGTSGQVVDLRSAARSGSGHRR